MKTLINLALALACITLIAAGAGCYASSPSTAETDSGKADASQPAETDARRTREAAPIFTADFENANLDPWRPTDPNAWRIEDGPNGKVLALFRQSKYSPEVRSPRNINLIENVEVGSFVLELDMQSTTKDYGHRDLCLFFGHQDPSHFYYVHIANASDAHANSIFLVNGEPRVSIAKTRTAGTKWDEKWHKVRLVRNIETGSIEVFFDDNPEPIMTAVDTHFKTGRIGVGSFDDTGRYDNIRIRPIPK